jgi:hypothetical protein
MKPFELEWAGSFAELCNRLFGPGAERYDNPMLPVEFRLRPQAQKG